MLTEVNGDSKSINEKGPSKVDSIEYTQSGNSRLLAKFTITYKVAVYAPAEWADTLTLFHFYQDMHSVDGSLFKLFCLLVYEKVHGGIGKESNLQLIQ